MPDDHAGMLSILVSPSRIITGGNDTLHGIARLSVPLLTQHPRQRALLLSDLARYHRVEEFWRLTSPVQGLCRPTTHYVTLEGRTIPAGRKVIWPTRPPTALRVFR